MKSLLKYLSADKIRELKSTFLALDSAGTGYVTYESLENEMRRLGVEMGNEEISSIFHKYGSEPGKINYTSFLIATLDRKLLLNEEIMWDVYRDFDPDNKGVLYLDQFKLALEKFGCELTDEEFILLLTEVKFDQTKGFTFEDFKKIMQSTSYLDFEEDHLAQTDQSEIPKRRLSKSRGPNEMRLSMN